METVSLGVVGWAEVKRHGRTLYVRLSELDIAVYDIKPGDKLKVELHSVIKGSREPRRKESHEKETE